VGTDKKRNLYELSLNAISMQLFGVEEPVVVEALLDSPNARGYIIGSISELLLRNSLTEQGFHVLRIKEKWEGPKIHHGDFYISKNEKDWFVIESKGLKSNSEKWAKTGEIDFYKKLSTKKSLTPDKVWFDQLPPDQKNILRNEVEQSSIRLCQTHMPSGKRTNENREDGRTQASPRYDEFHLLAVDMYTKTGQHQFVYALSNELSRSKKDSNHLLQNYFITLVMPSTLTPLLPLATPWELDISSLFPRLTNPINVDQMQVDLRKPGERAEGVISF
jgi:hypothetical protein